ncbi:unnamed protein product [Diatraea saccharalis]|uniref:DUF243 domain-containing protein n=1 Tax=Diatraea saccharalis TaxID=40085 RepID=A0A9N9N361_9NEOP|nr:unnamed protein product [Diatraea saccharalis]
MNALLVLTVAFGAVSADIGLGYQYKVPHTSYGVPSYQVGSNYNTGSSGVSGSNGYLYKGQSGYQGLSAGQQNAGYQGGYTGLQSGVATGTGYQTAGGGYQTTGSGSQYYTSPNTASSGVVSNTFQQPNYVSGLNGGQSGYQTYNQYQTQYQHKYQQQYQIQQQPAQVFKHYYVHAAPEEPEAAKPRNPIVLPAPQKHYKIIFIKTPAQAAVAPQYIPVQQQNEEKTIVYVLVKNPEDYKDIVVPKVEQKPPSKPEVYFIKYNSKEDSQSVINNIVNDYNQKGQSASFSNAGGEASTGSFTGQSALGSGVSSAGSGSSLVTGVSSTGAFSEQTSAGAGQIASTQTESQLLANFGSSFGQTGQSQEQNLQSDISSVFGSGTSGAVSLSAVETNDQGASSAFSSSTANYDSANTISASQGVPHETYGVPKFKVK